MKVESDLLSIVVLNYNGREVLEKCLNSVLSTDYTNLEIIVVDNASTDGSIEIAEKFAEKDKRLRIIKNQSNLGFVGGNNVGAWASRGKYVALLNNDTQVLPDWLDQPRNLMNSDPKIGLCEGKILTPDARVSHPGLYNPLGGMRKDSEPDNGQYDSVHQIFSPIGVAPVIRASLLREIGLFDPAIWWVGDVEDLSWRIHLRGYKVMYSPRCVIYHYARLGHKWYPKAMRMEVAFHATKNSFLTMLKNASATTLLRYVPVMAVMRMAELVYLSVTGNGNLFIIKIKAQLWVLRNLRYIWKSRSRIQNQIRSAPDGEVLRLMCKPRLWEAFSAYRAIAKSL